jgi:sodium/potassium/calcium exchanger 6
MDLQRSLIRPSLLAAEGSADGGIALPLNEGDRTLNIERDLPALLPVSHKTMDLLFPWYSRFNSLRPWKRVLGILGAPIWVMLRLTVPVVDEATMDFAGAPPLGNSDFDRSTRDSVEYSDGTLMAEDDDISPGPLHSPPGNDGMPPWARFSRAPLRWHRWLSAINLATFPTIFVLGVFGGDSTVGDSAMPSWSLSLIIGLAVSALFVLTTRNDQPPRWYGALAFVGFTAGIVWIYMIANLLVGLLQTLGIIFGVSEALMGLTIFAWGNSMGDLMTDVSLARMGYAELAMGACYGSPMLSG